MINALVIGILLIFLGGCNTLSLTYRYTPDPMSFLTYAAYNKDVKTIVVGHPASVKKSDLEKMVTYELNDSYGYLQTNFTTANSDKIHQPYKIVFVFNPPFQTTAHEICAAPQKVKTLPIAQKLSIAAVFCEETPLSEVWANVDYFGDNKNQNLRDAIKQLAAYLVPEEEPEESWPNERLLPVQ